MSYLVKNESNSPADLSAVHICFSGCVFVFSSLISPFASLHVCALHACPPRVRWNFPGKKGSDLKKWEPVDLCGAAQKRIFFRPLRILEPYFGQRDLRDPHAGCHPFCGGRFLRQIHPAGSARGHDVTPSISR